MSRARAAAAPHPCELSVQRTEVGLLMQHHGEVRSPFVDCDELSLIEDAPFHIPQQFILAKTPWCTKLCV
jgi:hypothetical protein